MAGTWIDLLDPSAEELRAKAPKELEDTAIKQLLAPPEHEDDPRPTLQGHGDYIFGIFLVVVAVPDEDTVFYQEIDVVLTHDTLLTVRKTPPGGRPACDFTLLNKVQKPGESAGMMAYRLVDEIAERYLDLVDTLNDEIDELEDRVETQAPELTRTRISSLRHDLLHIRRTLSPMRDSVRRVIDNTVEVEEGEEVFPHDVEVAFNAAYDKFLRASDGLDFARDLLAGVRDYQQAKIANDQNDVMKRLAVLATVFLPLTFLTGFFGQNFLYLTQNVEIPEWTFWALGVGLEIAAAIALFVLIQRRRWL